MRAPAGGIVVLLLAGGLSRGGGGQTLAHQADVAAPRSRLASAVPGDTIPLPPRDTSPPWHPSIGDVVYFPLFFGVRVPSYDRTNGLSLPWGPQLALPDDRVVVDMLLTYRSHLGHVDPSVSSAVRISRQFSLDAAFARGTFTNDGWSAPDFVNSGATLVNGSDGRNYFRADRAQAAVAWHSHRTDETMIDSGYVGLRDEFAHSVGPDTAPEHTVWSLFNQSNPNGIRRPNPPIRRGRLISSIAGASVHWTSAVGASADGSIDIEVPWTTPGAGHFAQVTLGAAANARTFGAQRWMVRAHALLTAGDAAPPQRFSYLGGANNLATLRMLALGGDELLSIQTEYVVPLPVFTLPVVGVPAIELDYLTGSAGVHRLPRFTHNIGGGVRLFVVEVEVLFDPATHRHAVILSGALPGF